MSQWRDLTADQVADLLEGGLDGNFDILDASGIEADAADAEFLDKILQGLEAGVDDPTGALDDLAADDEDYWLPEGEVDTEDQRETVQRRGQASGRSSRSAQKPSASNKRKRSQERRKLAQAIRTGHLPARHIRSALNRGRQKLSVAQQRHQRVQESFLVNPNDQASAEAGSASATQASKPEVVRRRRTPRDQADELQSTVKFARSDVTQEKEKLEMLLKKSGDSTKIEAQKQAVKQAEAALTTANSELLAIQVRHINRKLPAGKAYQFTEAKTTQGPFTAQQLVKVARQLKLANKTEVRVDSRVMNQGAMFVYLDILLPLLENTRNLVNITPVNEPARTVQPGRGGAKPRHQDNNGARRDPKLGTTNGQDWRAQGTAAGPNEQWAPGYQGDRGRFIDSGARLRGNSASDNAQQKKRMQQQKKYEEESMALQEELTLELYTLETKNGDLWGPHSFEALSSLVERKEIFEEQELMCDTEYGVSLISYVDLNQRMKERREKVQRLKQYANDAALHAAAEKPPGAPNPPNKRQTSPNENLQLQHSMPGPPPAVHGQGMPPAAAKPDGRREELPPAMPVTDRQPSVEAAPSGALLAPPSSMPTGPAQVPPGPAQSNFGGSSVNQPGAPPAHVDILPPHVHASAPSVKVKQEPANLSTVGTLPSAPMEVGGSSVGPSAFPGPPAAMPNAIPPPTAAFPVGVETVHAGAQPLEPPNTFNAVQPYAQPQPSGYGVPEAPLPGAVPAQTPVMPPQNEQVAQPPLPPQELEMDELDEGEIEDIRFTSFKELMDHVRENDMDHLYQVILEKAGQQYPTRVAQLDVWALLAFKDAPLHIAERALKEFVKENHEPDKASEDFRALLGQ